MVDAALRVVYVDHCASLSGAQLALWRLLEALGPRVEAHVVLAEDGPMVDKLREAAATVELLPMARGAQGFQGEQLGAGAAGPGVVAATATYAARLAWRLRRLRPDLVHTNSLKAALYGPAAARMAGVPVVVQFRDRIAHDFLPPAACRLVRTAARILPSAILGNETVLPTLAPNARPQFAVVDPVDSRCFQVAARDPSDGPLRVGIVGRIVRWKGQHVFLDAFARAFPEGDSRAVLVGSALLGDDAYEPELRAQAGRLGIAHRVDFRGFRADVPAELARLDIAVHASVIPEPFGQVVTEAMAAGVAVVAAAAGGPALIITHGVDGMLTPPGDATALAGALRQLGGDPALRARLAGAGRERARAFSGDVVAEQVLSAYRCVLGARSSRRSRAVCP